MILPEDFAITIDYDEEGLQVVVTHKPTGIIRAERPSCTESVGSVKDRLIAEIRQRFPAPQEFIINRFYGRNLLGESCTSYQVCHEPSSKSRYLKSGMTRDEIQAIMDEIATELWNESATQQENEKKS